jgi:hypothetical protein
MTSSEFVYWIKGYLAAQTYDSQIKIDIEKALKDIHKVTEIYSGIIPMSSNLIATSGSIGGNISHTIWNDQMGCWHYTNYPEGFGYYTNSTLEGKKEKQQLND